MKILLLILPTAAVAAAAMLHFHNKIALANKGHRLDWSEGDDVSVSEEDLQEFMFEMLAADNAEPAKDSIEIIIGGHHAVA